jgi:general secretion pathway protein M
MKDWFESLDLRERQFVSVGSVVVIIALLYGLIWAPLDKKYSELQADMVKWQNATADLRPLRVAMANGGPAQTTTRSSSQQSPLIIVDTSLLSRGLDRYRRNSQPTTSNGIRVVFEDVAFDELVIWLGDLSEQYSMHLKNGSFSAGSSAAPGRINATVTLERSL